MSSSPQVITCKAAVCWEKGEEAIKVEEIQVDPPKSSEVRIRMLCASICHTDILRAHGHPFPYFPRVLGHEGVGVVESIGDEVTNCKRGDVVIPTFIGECEECENCVSGESNLCLEYPVRRTALMADNTSRMSIRGQMLYQLFTCSTWSEYIVVDANYVIKIDPSVDHALASLISCGFSTGFGAAWKEAKVVSGSTVAVFGLGAVGLGAVSGAKMLGATKIIGIDKNEMKKEKGEAFGMTDFINTSDRSDKSTSELVKEMTGGMGVDYCFECTGAAPLIYETIEASKVGRGKIILIGAGPQTNVQINIVSLLFGRTLRGSIFGGLKPKSDLPTIIDKCQKKEIPIHELVTHEVSLTDINKAFELLKQPNCVKIIIKI